jgi:hypothetical protein
MYNCVVTYSQILSGFLSLCLRCCKVTNMSGAHYVQCTLTPCSRAMEKYKRRRPLFFFLQLSLPCKNLGKKNPLGQPQNRPHCDNSLLYHIFLINGRLYAWQTCLSHIRFASFPSPAGMSLPNSPWAGIMTSYLNYSCLGGVWLVTSRLETGNSWTFFHCVCTNVTLIFNKMYCTFLSERM